MSAELSMGIEEDVEGVPKDGDRPIEVGIVGSVPTRDG